MTERILLGPVRKYHGAEAAEVGKWLVVFQQNRAIQAHPTGIVVSRLRGRVPLFGASIALLDTTPFRLDVPVRKIRTKDGYFVPEVLVQISVRINPDTPKAQNELISLINRDAGGLFDSIEARVRDVVSRQARSAIAAITAINLVTKGEKSSIFPSGTVDLSSIACIEVTALHDVRSDEPSWAAEVRGLAERATAATQSADSRARIREHAAADAIHQTNLDHGVAKVQQSNEHELETANLDALSRRAEDLGVPLLALAEPEVYARMSGQQHEILKTMLEQPHLARFLRTNHNLASAVMRQLGGLQHANAARGSQPSPLLERRAQVLIDAANPSGMRALGLTPDVSPTSVSSIELRSVPLFLDPWVKTAWNSSGGSPGLIGASLSVTLDRMKAFVILMAKSKVQVPSTFKKVLLDSLRSDGGDLVEIEGLMVTGTTFESALRKVVEVVAGNGPVTPIFQARGADGQRELLVELSGDSAPVSRAYSHLSSPDYPGVHALENLACKQLRIRIIPPTS